MTLAELCRKVIFMSRACRRNKTRRLLYHPRCKLLCTAEPESELGTLHYDGTKFLFCMQIKVSCQVNYNCFVYCWSHCSDYLSLGYLKSDFRNLSQAISRRNLLSAGSGSGLHTASLHKGLMCTGNCCRIARLSAV